METIASIEPISYLEMDKANTIHHAVVNILGCREIRCNLSESLIDLLTNFDALDNFLLSPAQLTYVFLYDFPNMPETSKDLESFFRLSLKWSRITPIKLEEQWEEQLHTVGEWKSIRGTRILTKGRRFELPQYIQREPELLNNPNWLGCVGIRRSVSYNLYSGAVFSHHIFSEPILDEFDYVLKVDLDILFSKIIPFSPTSLMRDKDCVFMHSEIKVDKSDCNAGVVQAARDFAEILGGSLSSLGYEWCAVPHYFYGNFLGFNMAFYSSPKQQYFSRWLYECVEDGYFRYRWGDQAPLSMYLCLARDIPDIKNNSDICSLESWRGTIFQHF